MASEKDDHRLHRLDEFTLDLGRLVRRERYRCAEIGDSLSEAIDHLLVFPRKDKLPITLYDKESHVWEFRFFPGYSFLYWAEDVEIEGSGRVERHYHLLRVLEKPE